MWKNTTKRIQLSERVLLADHQSRITTKRQKPNHYLYTTTKQMAKYVSLRTSFNLMMLRGGVYTVLIFFFSEERDLVSCGDSQSVYFLNISLVMIRAQMLSLSAWKLSTRGPGVSSHTDLPEVAGDLHGRRWNSAEGDEIQQSPPCGGWRLGCCKSLPSVSAEGLLPDGEKLAPCLLFSTLKRFPESSLVVTHLSDPF